LLYDLTTVFTHSRNIRMAEKGYNNERKYCNQLGVVIAFSVEDMLPAGIEVYWGSMKDITTIKDFLERFRKRSMGFILDRSGEEIFDLYKGREDVYRSLGLAFIPPELREDQGEIEAAIDGTLPDLIKHEDIRGDLHIHSTWSDGRNSIQEMVDKARSLGYCYIAICDHSPAVGVVHGVDEVKLLDEMDEIDRINDSLTDFKVLKGIEVDIRSDGKLDLPDKALEPLDIVVAAVHTGLSQSKEEMTARIISAIENPNVDVIAHPTGRIIGKRDPCDLDIEAIVDACIDYDTILEINANPRRLDLNDTHARYARNRGVKLAISTDAHDTSQMDLMHFGVATARRGWLLKEDVVNTELVYVN
ncbi:DNA polymerase/3'-5' exonuclease PolX, partial [Methanosarcinales archaeon]